MAVRQLKHGVHQRPWNSMRAKPCPPLQDELDLLLDMGLPDDWYTLHEVQRTWWELIFTPPQRRTSRHENRVRMALFEAEGKLSDAAWFLFFVNKMLRGQDE